MGITDYMRARRRGRLPPSCTGRLLWVGVDQKVPLARALDMWAELQLLPIRHMVIGDIPQLLGLAVKHNLSVYDS
jgi:hypothetical protein